MNNKKVKIVNLLSTDLTLMRGPKDGGLSTTYKNPGPSAIVESKMVPIARLYPNGQTNVSVPLLQVTEQRVVGLPDPEPDTLYVVSGAVAGFVKGDRPDVVTPSRIIEDEDGWIVGCRALLQIRREMKG